MGFTGVYRRAWAVPRLESDARVGPRMDAAGLYFMVGIIMHVFLKKKGNNARAHGVVCADKRDSAPIKSLELMTNLLLNLGTNCGANQLELEPRL